jgi:prevent-host-death family protein
MSRTYSTYEAKSRFSEVIRQVRAGRRVVIAYRGEPVAEIRPITPSSPRFSDRLARLMEQGVVVPQPAGRLALRPLGSRSGALKRFLAERD